MREEGTFRERRETVHVAQSVEISCSQELLQESLRYLVHRILMQFPPAECWDLLSLIP
jgi:hypothetical protein